jgi:hypothetical protein
MAAGNCREMPSEVDAQKVVSKGNHFPLLPRYEGIHPTQSCPQASQTLKRKVDPQLIKTGTPLAYMQDTERKEIRNGGQYRVHMCLWCSEEDQ